MIAGTACFSERGARDANQDAVYASAEGDRGIFVVADGMGGHSGGGTASKAVVDGIRSWWDGNDFAAAGTAIDLVAGQCHSLLTNINGELYAYFRRRGQTGGSTAVVLILWGDRFSILSAGDSRVYRARGKVLEQLTRDDVWENLPEVKYGMSNEKVVCDSRFGKLTEALGSEKSLRIGRVGGMLRGRELFLLCSDGVYKYCSHEALKGILCAKAPFRGVGRRAEMLRERVEKNGAEDNYSAVICSVRNSN